MTKFSARMASLPIKSRTSQSIILKIRKQLVFLSILIIGGLGSCKKTESFGLQVQPQQDILAINQTDSTTLITYSVKEDSLLSDELNGPNMLGFYTFM